MQQDWKAAPFYARLHYLLIEKHETEKIESKKLKKEELALLKEMSVDSLEEECKQLQHPICLIHNDFNPRNVMIRKDGKPCIYDWELIMWDYPERDVMEWLSFVLTPNATKQDLELYLRAYYKLENSNDLRRHVNACLYALKSLILTRFALYEVAGIVSDFPFSLRVLKTALHLFRLLKD